MRRIIATALLLLMLGATAQAGMLSRSRNTVGCLARECPGQGHRLFREVRILRQDMQRLLTCKNLGIAVAGLGAAGLAHPWDDDVKGELEGLFLFEASADLTNIYGASSFNLPAALGLWTLGKATRREPVAQLGSALLRTLAFTQLAVAPFKLAVRRQRPDRSNRLSFPSGHAANSVAMARLLHRYYGPRAGLPLYLLSALVAAGRLEDDRHYLSDVVMGAFLGGIVGNSVTLRRGNAVAVWPHLTPDGLLLILRIDGNL